MIIAVDIDETLVLGAEPILNDLNHHFGTEFKISDMPNESFTAYVVAIFAERASREELIKLMEAFVVSDDYTSLPPIAGAESALKKLVGAYELIALSHRPAIQVEATKRWIDNFLPGIFANVVVLNTGKFGSNEATPISKGEYCAAHGIFVIIDDKPSACLDVIDHGRQAILFGDYPWNNALQHDKRVTWCKDWAAITEHFNAKG